MSIMGRILMIKAMVVLMKYDDNKDVSTDGNGDACNMIASGNDTMTEITFKICMKQNEINKPKKKLHICQI